MNRGSGDAAREAVVATVTTALRQQARDSVHPADQTALRHAAARIVRALDAQFLLVSRHTLNAELPDDQQMNAAVHE
jgi:hypothetical protein